MKKLVQVERSTCDFCNDTDQTWQVCCRCGKDVCYNCRKCYPRELHISSSADPAACPDCAVWIESHPEYLGPLAEILKLREERDASYKDFEQRRREAEGRAKDFVPPPM